MPIGIVHPEPDGTISYANAAALRILGLTKDQIHGRTSVHPEWRAVHEDGSDFPGETHPAMVALRTGVEVRGTIMGVYNPSTGTNTWLNINATPIFEPGKDRPSGAFFDRHERRPGDKMLGRSVNERGEELCQP